MLIKIETAPVRFTDIEVIANSYIPENVILIKTQHKCLLMNLDTGFIKDFDPIPQMEFKPDFKLPEESGAELRFRQHTYGSWISKDPEIKGGES